MTYKQIERSANVLHELAVAAMIGSSGDIFIFGIRRGLDVLVMILALSLFGWSLKLTGQLGGHRL